jgi:hypothetical protein
MGALRLSLKLSAIRSKITCGLLDFLEMIPTLSRKFTTISCMLFINQWILQEYFFSRAGAQIVITASYQASS